MATPGVPYGYTLVPTQQLLPQGQRLVPVHGGRNVYSVMDLDDEEEEYAPPPRPRSRVLDDLDSPEMDEFSATTRQIRKDANSILERLGTSKPKSKASQLFSTYDYDTRPITSRYLAPAPDRSHLRGHSPLLDDELDPVLQSLRPGRRTIGTCSRPLTNRGTDRIFTPQSMTANRIQSLYNQLDEPVYAPEIKHFDYTECLRRDRPESIRRDREAAREKVTGDINRRATLLEPSSGLAEARERRSSVKRERLGYDPNSVKSNISIRAQYAAMRAAATRTVRTPTPSALLHIPNPRQAPSNESATSASST